MTVNVGLLIALLSSISINIFGLWYIRDILGRLTWISENINDIANLVGAYLEHLKNVHQLEQFYGDKEIKTLVDHTKELLMILEDYQTAVLELEPVDVEELNEEENNDGEEKESIQKDVFYAGSRRRDS